MRVLRRLLSIGAKKQGLVGVSLIRDVKKHVREVVLPQLVPPVANSMLFSGTQLKVMIVGGPNVRDDFHIEAGEEFFCQMQGGMDLDVMQAGQRMRLPIREGDYFVLPVLVPHSPQRYENTFGLVIERARKPTELDTLRWYIPGSNNILYQETFFCSDLGSQIKQVIDRFMERNSWKQTLDSSESAPPEPLISTPSPSSLAGAIEQAPLASKSVLIDSEFVVSLFKGTTTKTAVVDQSKPTGEAFLWQQTGTSRIISDDLTFELTLGCQDVALLPLHLGLSVLQDDSSSQLVAITNKIVA